jgi:hypothetical protein
MTDQRYERDGETPLLRSPHLTTAEKIMMLVEHLQVTLTPDDRPEGGLNEGCRCNALRMVNEIGWLVDQL